MEQRIPLTLSLIKSQYIPPVKSPKVQSNRVTFLRRRVTSRIKHWPNTKGTLEERTRKRQIFKSLIKSKYCLKASQLMKWKLIIFQKVLRIRLILSNAFKFRTSACF
jgi:hypothetical protein